MRQRDMLRVALLLCAVIALPSCTQGEDEPQAARTSVTFAAALEQANAEGQRRAEEIARLSEQSKGQGLERTLEIYAAIADQAQTARDGYAALAVPREVAPQMATVLRLLTDQVEVLNELGPIARTNDRDGTAQAISRLSQLTGDLQQARQQLDAALLRCGKPCS